MRDERRSLNGIFNRNADLLAELEKAREDETGFFADEKEFLFRSALGDQRLSAKKPISRSGTQMPAAKAGSQNVMAAAPINNGTPKESLPLVTRLISLEGWAELSVDGDIQTFFDIMREALSQRFTVRIDGIAHTMDVGDESVRRDAIALLTRPEFRRRLDPAQLTELLKLTRDAALDGPPEVAAPASVAICQLCQPLGATELFQEMKDGNKRREARRAVGWVRDAADRREIDDLAACREFERQWRQEALPRRALVLAPLWLQRLLRSFGWMFFVVVMSTVMTAFGAALAFVPMGLVGASLTLADKSAGWIKGPFHGLAGGTFWGIGISASLLFYWVILRGGRVSPNVRNWIPAALIAAFGGFVAGIALAFVIGFVFQPQSLFTAGWLIMVHRGEHEMRDRLVDIFLHTRHGWWPPILGAAVGMGVSWSLQKVSADQRAENFLKRQSSAIQQKREAFRAMAKILKAVAKRSWRILAPLAVGGLLVFYLLKPGPGICDTSTLLNTPKATCSQDLALASKSARVAGIVVIIWAGGIFLELGILFGIFVARAGVKLERDEHFLQAFKD